MPKRKSIEESIQTMVSLAKESYKDVNEGKVSKAEKLLRLIIKLDLEEIEKISQITGHERLEEECKQIYNSTKEALEKLEEGNIQVAVEIIVKLIQIEDLLLEEIKKFRIPHIGEVFLSVIIPAHNEEDFIGATLDTLRSQSYKNYELIVICDDCTDNTEIIARNYDAKTYNIKAKNAASARNKGAKLARGNVLVFHDADTIAPQNYFEEITKAIKENYVFGCAKLKAETKHPLGLAHAIILNYYSRIKHYFHGNNFIRKDVFVSVGGYNESLDAGEDTDLAERIRIFGEFKYIKKTFLISSERKFKERGYTKEFTRMGVEGMKYLHTRKKYYQEHTKK